MPLPPFAKADILAAANPALFHQLGAKPTAHVVCDYDSVEVAKWMSMFGLSNTREDESGHTMTLLVLLGHSVPYFDGLRRQNWVFKRSGEGVQQDSSRQSAAEQAQRPVDITGLKWHSVIPESLLSTNREHFQLHLYDFIATEDQHTAEHGGEPVSKRLVPERLVRLTKQEIGQSCGTLPFVHKLTNANVCTSTESDVLMCSNSLVDPAMLLNGE